MGWSRLKIVGVQTAHSPHHSKGHQRAKLVKFAPQGIIHDDGAAVGERLHRMGHIGRYDGDYARAGNLGDPVDGHLELALDHFIDYFLEMEALVNGGAAPRNRVGGPKPRAKS